MWDWDAHAIENVGRERRRDMMREASDQRLASAAAAPRAGRFRRAVGLLLVRYGIRLVAGNARTARSRSAA